MGSTDAGVGYATGKAWFKVPESLLFKIEGELAPGVTGKDVILHIIGMIGVDGRALPGHGIHRQRHSEHGHGRAHEHLEYGHRSGR